MNVNAKKIIISVIAIIVLSAGIGAYFVFQKHALPQEPTKFPEQTDKDSPFGIHDPGFPKTDNDIASIGAKGTRYAGGDGLVWGAIESKKSNMTGNITTNFIWKLSKKV